MSESKSYKLTVTRKAGYVHAIASGPNTQENMKGYLEELLAQCIAQGHRRVLIEERLVGPRIGMMDVFDLGSVMSDRARAQIEALAFVDINAKDDRNLKFGENVAVNRGLRARMFRTVEDAENWLKQAD
ncbi:MAG TPA: hypothetical protein VEH03_08045 [Burkholderiales bacterium]|nr:hypothetical protein [Burkholderiales bacterium]